jgi:hypothetical protein
MLEKRKLSRNAETDRCIQLADGFLIPAKKELSAFIRAVDNCSALSRPANRRWTGSRNWNRWIGRLGNRFQIGVGLRWAQVLGLTLCCLAVANQNLEDSCERSFPNNLE